MKLYHIDEEPTHELEYVKEIEPMVQRSIKKLHNHLEKLDNKFSKSLDYSMEGADEYYQNFNRSIEKWTDSMRRLGGVPLSTIRVRFMLTNGGYYVINKDREADLYD